MNEDLGPVVIGVASAGIAVATIVVLLRLYTRAFVTRNLWWDDFTMFMSWVVLFAAIPVGGQQVQDGFGRHYATLTPDEKIKVAKWQVVVELMSFISLFFLRISVPLFLLRLLRGTSFRLGRWVKRALWAVMAVNALASLIVCAVYGTECVPLRAVWDKRVHGRCYTMRIIAAVLSMYGGVGIVLDLACAILPYPVIYGLNLSTRRKRALYVLLSLGIIPAACAAGKAIVSNHPTDDFTTAWVPTELLAVFEGATGMAMASLPACAALARAPKARAAGPARLGSSDSVQGVRRAWWARVPGWARRGGEGGQGQTQTQTSSRHRIYVTRDVRVEADSDVDRGEMREAPV